MDSSLAFCSLVAVLSVCCDSVTDDRVYWSGVTNGVKSWSSALDSGALMIILKRS